MKRDVPTTTKRSLRDRRRGETDWARFDALTDEDIEAAVANDPDAAPLLDEDFWAGAEMIVPHAERAED